VPDRGYYVAFAILAGIAGVVTVATVVYGVATRGGDAGFWISMGVFLVVAAGLLGFAARALAKRE
jgi:hypothetical protein